MVRALCYLIHFELLVLAGSGDILPGDFFILLLCSSRLPCLLIHFELLVLAGSGDILPGDYFILLLCSSRVPCVSYFILLLCSTRVPCVSYFILLLCSSRVPCVSYYTMCFMLNLGFSTWGSACKLENALLQSVICNLACASKKQTPMRW